MKPATINEALLYGIDVRVSNGDKWLVIEQGDLDDTPVYVVYQRKRGAKKTQRLCDSFSERTAVSILMEED